ncbi:YihY/virulence factor BrkB family protein [Sphingomonas nostoxanthinifaciens]|uniref:YihY/virulence factor BrkB family protein n=1 Tax=Sphingomonas nostoxanthinifaciens TaxID=2872652 RepID=UPI001CC20C26|nr:YihY/virulence factor BrkB family protein [Sphingomonas nostoxanthinifaciens]
MSLSEWKAVVLRAWNEGGGDNIGLIAAGVAFYGFLALVPLLGAIVLSYGLLADSQTVVDNMKGLTSVMPTDAAKLVGEQLMNVVKTSGSKKGFGVLLALAIALFGARNGAGSVITALNIAYEEKEKRGFLALNALALAITAAAVAVAIIALIAIAALGHLENLIPGAPGVVLVLGKLLSYLLLGCGGAAAAATLYRYGPSRAKARWAWITPGSLLAALCWLLLTLGFGIYVAKFGNYNATYGSLGAVVVMLTWIYLSSYVLLFGAELNAELEHQTTADTTEGAVKPAGERGAWVADHVAADPAVANTADVTRPAPPVKQEEPSQAEPSITAAFIASRTSVRVARLIGLKKVGMMSSVMTAVGLSLIRKPGKAGAGAALVVTAVVSAWLTRERDLPKS